MSPGKSGKIGDKQDEAYRVSGRKKRQNDEEAKKSSIVDDLRHPSVSQ
jgi:hypothetical protein